MQLALEAARAFRLLLARWPWEGGHGQGYKRPPPLLSLAYRCFFSSTNVSNHAVTHVYTRTQTRTCYSRASDLNSPLHLGARALASTYRLDAIGTKMKSNYAESRIANHCNRTKYTIWISTILMLLAIIMNYLLVFKKFLTIDCHIRSGIKSNYVCC